MSTFLNSFLNNITDLQLRTLISKLFHKETPEHEIENDLSCVLLNCTKKFIYCLVLVLFTVQHLRNLSLSKLLNALYITTPVFNFTISSNFNKLNSRNTEFV